jgi:cytochrome c553
LLQTRRWALLLAALLSYPGNSQEACGACHGPDGNSPAPAIPSIAGQPKLFLENQLILFREELRRSPVMLPIVKGMKDADIAQLASLYSKLPSRSMEADPGDKGLVQQGMQAAKKLRCDSCHVGDFSGQNQVPRLAGQREQYLRNEMRAYRDGERSGGDTIMAAALYGVSDADIRALAHFLARRSPPAPGG